MNKTDPRPFGIHSCYRNILSLTLRPSLVRNSRQQANSILPVEGFGEIEFNHSTGILEVQQQPAAVPIFLKAPLMVSIAITGRCNMRCQHCYPTIRDVEFDLAFLTRLFQELHEMGVFSLSISGGEPLLHPDLEAIIALGRDLGFHLTLFTNGLLLDRRKARHLKALGVEEVNISLDATDATQHDRFRGVSGAFEKSLQAVRNGLEAEINTWITCTVSNTVHMRAVDFASLAIELGVNKLRLVEVVSTGNASKNSLTYDPSWATQLGEALAYLRDRLGRDIIPASYFDFEAWRSIFRTNMPYSPFGCGAGTLRARITADGQVLGCPFLSLDFPNENGPIRPDNIFSKSFAEIWAGSPYLQAFRAGTQAVQGSCQLCEHNLMWCRAGCRAEAFFRHGRLDASDPLCRYRQDCDAAVK